MPTARTWLDRYYERSLRLGAAPRLLGQFNRQSRHAFAAWLAVGLRASDGFWGFVFSVNPS